MMGGSEETKTIAVSWNPATDANGDDLTYDLYLLDDSGNQIGSALVASSTNTSFTFDITSIDNGVYNLRGVVCDEEPLCTTFTLGNNFTIAKASIIYSLLGVSLSSNNSLNQTKAKTGDEVTLEFDVSDAGDISESLDVKFYADGELVQGSVSKNEVAGVWTASFVVSPLDSDGPIDFVISADNLDALYSNTSNNTCVTIDNTSPSSITVSPSAGSYSSDQNISLRSTGSSLIRYTIDGTEPSCTNGTIYTSSFIVSESQTIKAIACDDLNNSTAIETLIFSINYPVSSGGTIVGQVNNLVALGQIDQANELKRQWPNLFPAGTFSPITKKSSVVMRPVFSRNLFLGSKGEDVRNLQRFLNNQKFFVSKIGLGSPGKETNFFGRGTQGALIRFQKAKGITPTRGYFGPVIREFVNKNWQ